MAQAYRMNKNHDLAQLSVGAAGIGMGMINQIVHWAQVISIIGGAIIVIVTLIGMIIKGWKSIFNKVR